MPSYIFPAVRALAMVVIAASLWPFLAGPYNRLVASSADAFSPGGIGVSAANGWFHLVFLDGVAGDGLNLHGFMLHFGLILVLALMAATPRMSLVRLAAWLVGAAGLFLVIHIAGFSLLVWGLWWAFQDNTFIMDTGQVFAAFAIFWALVPAIIGGAWCYRYWLPALRSGAPVVDSTAKDVSGPLQMRNG